MAAKVLDLLVKKNPVVVFSRNPCPYCVNVKKLFDSLGVKYAEFGFGGEVKVDDEAASGYDIQEYIGEKFNHYTVPVVFINGEFIGGYDNTSALNKSGKLKSMLGLN